MGLRFDKRYLREYGAFDPLDLDYGPVAWPDGYVAPSSGFTYVFGDAYTPPSSGSWAYDFAAVIGGDQTIYATGFDTAEVGSPAAQRQEFLLPGGIDTAEFGTTWISNWQQYAVPSGIDAAAVGTASLVQKFIRNHNWVDAYTAPLGSAINHVFGAASPTISPTGIDALEFGTTFVQTTPSIHPAGIDGVAFGSHTVYKQQFIVPAGLDTQEFGTTAVENENRYFDFTGFDAAEFGSAALTQANFPQTLTPLGDDHARLGVQVVTKSLEIPLAYMGIDSLEFGTTEVSLFTRTVYPDEIDAAEFGTTEISNYYRYLPIEGIDGMEFGDTLIRRHSPYPEGFDTAEFGSHTVSNYRQIISPTGWDSLWVSTNVNERHVVSNYIRYLTPGGVNGMAFGTTFISNFIRYLSPAGIAPPALGTTSWVSFYTRYLSPSGWDSAAVWWDFGPLDPVTLRPPGVHNETGHVVATGIDAANVGTPTLTRTAAGMGEWTQRASFGDYRAIVGAGGIDAVAFGSASVGISSIAWLTPTGFDVAEFGAARLASVVAPAGFDTQVIGSSQVNMGVSVAGLDAHAVGTPQLNFGVTGIGFDAAEFGATQIDIVAFATGFDALEFGTPAIGHRIAPSGFDSLTFEADYVDDGYVGDGYTVTYNHDVSHAP